jgi:F-type H+-transporting ATPase subunit c
MRIFFLFAMVLLACAMPTFAQTPQATGGGFTLHPAFAMAIASGLCGLGQGKAVASSAEAIARNPGAGTVIRGALLLGLILIESLALYTLVIIFAV